MGQGHQAQPRSPRAVGDAPVRSQCGASACRSPRAVGDAPPMDLRRARHPQFSPRGRGCSGGFGRPPQASAVLPARSGMLREPYVLTTAQPCSPRAVGDAPHAGGSYGTPVEFSPRGRGCSGGTGLAGAVVGVLPARSGMLRVSCGCDGAPGRSPRAVGDAPRALRVDDRTAVFSPRGRGCSAAVKGQTGPDSVLPARPGMLRPGPRWPRRPLSSLARPGSLSESPYGTYGYFCVVLSFLSRCQWLPLWSRCDGQRGCAP